MMASRTSRNLPPACVDHQESAIPMRNRLVIALSAALFAGASLVSLSAPARAMPVGPAPAVANGIETVQWNGNNRGRVQGGRGYRGGPVYGGRRGYVGRPVYGRGYGYRRGIDPGAAAAAGIAGLAAGALLSGALSQQGRYVEEPVYGAPVYGAPAYEAPDYGSASPEDYCARRYRSYDPASGTYLGFDGLRHPCP
jgi:hypothetical protein